MGNTTIPNLPAAISLNGTEQFWAVQNGADVRITTAQIAGVSLGAPIHQEPLTVTAPNTLSSTTFAPNGTFTLLVVNGGVYLPVGSSPAFSTSGTNVSWNAANAGFSLATTDSVIAVYNYTAV